MIENDTAFPLLRFVEAPVEDAQDAVVRYDLNPTGIKDPGFSYGAVGFDGEPDAIAPTLGLRRLSFVHYLHGNKVVTMADQSLLARELMRPRNWLLVQLSPLSKPAYFHTYRSPAVAVDFTFVSAYDEFPDLWQLPLSLASDPWVETAEVAWDPFTVTNDPTDDGCVVTLPDVQGNLPSPLKIVAENLDFDDNMKYQMWVVAAGDSDPSPVVVSPVDPETGVDAPVTSSQYVGGRYYQTNATLSATDVTVIRTPFDGSIPSDGWRRYRVMVRIQGTGSDTTFAMHAHIVASTGGDTVARTTDVLVTSDTDIRWVNLGDIQFPPDLGIFPDRQINVKARRVSGTAQLRIDDVIVLIPIEDDELESDTCYVTANRTISGLGYLTTVIDGMDTLAFYEGSVTELSPSPIPAGTFPHVRPGVTNVLSFFRAVSGGDIAGPRDDLTATATVTISYRPRWLFLPDG